MSTWAAPGKPCVCIDDNWDECRRIPGWPPSTRVPMLNEVLTIKDVIDDHPLRVMVPGGVLLTFVELGHDDCFAIENFAEPVASEPADPDNLDYGSEYDG